MKKFIKIAGIAFGVVILLLIVAIIVVPLVVDINDYKGRIISMVEKQTGRKLNIQGDIGLSVFPRLGVKLDTVELGNASGFEAPVFARVNQLQIRVRILPLLSRRLEADVVVVRGLSLNLERNKDGRTNWDDLIKTTPEKKPEKTDKEPIAAGALALGGVDVREASIMWTDRVSGKRIAVKDVSVKTSAVTLVDPIDVKVGFKIDTGDVGLSGPVEAGTRIHFDLNRNIFKISDFKLGAELKGKAVPGGSSKIKAEGAAALDAGARRINIDRFKLEVGGLSQPPYTTSIILETAGSGDLTTQNIYLPTFKVDLNMSAKKERITASLAGNVRGNLKAKKIVLSDLALSLPEFNTKGARIQLSAPQKSSATIDLAGMTLNTDVMKIVGTISGKTLPGGSMPVAFGFRAKADFNRQSLTLDSLQLEALGMKTEGRLLVDKFQTAPDIKGELSMARFNPRELLSRLVKNLPNMADSKSLSSASFSINFAATANSLNAHKLTVDIDDSRLTGTASVNNFTKPDVRFDLGMERLNLDRYLPPKQSGNKAAAAAAPAAGAAAAGGMPLETLRKLSVNGKIRIADLTASGMKMTKLELGIHAKGGVIRTDPFSAALYDGDYTGSVEYDVRGKEPKIRFDEKLLKVRLDRLLKALAVNTGTMDISGPSTLSLKGSVVTDAAFKLIRVDQLVLDGNIGNKLPLGLDSGGMQINLNDQTLTADTIKVTLDDMKIRVKTKVTGLLTKPSHKTDIHVPAFNLRQVLTKIGKKPPETFDPKAMTVFDFAASATGSDTGISVESIKVRLDDTRLEGRLEIKSKPAPSYTFDIRLDGMDLDRYLPPKKKGSTPVAATPGAASAGLPMDLLRTLNLDGKLVVGKLKISNIRLQNIQAQAKGKDGLLTLNPLQAGLYGGSYNGNISLDARGKQPQLAVDEKLDKVQVGPLLKDLQGRAMLTGLTSTGIKLNATGADADAIRRSLNGKVAFLFTEGSIEKVDIIGKICRALSGISAGSLKKEDLASGVLQMITQQAKGGEKQSSGRTEFSEMRGGMVFTNGIGTNEDLILNSPLLRVEGGGKLDLPRQLLDYKATVALVKSCEGQGGKSFREMANYPIPVSVTGPLGDLNVKPNLTAGILQILKPQPAKEQPAAAPQQIPPSPQPSEQPEDMKKQAEEAVKGILKKGLQDLMKKQ